MSDLLLSLKNKKIYLYLFIIPTILVFFNGIMIIFPKEIIKAAEKGLLLWFNKVIPTLLPFIICTNMLIGMDFPEMLGILLGKFSKIFRLRGICLFPLISGVISGYPIGIKSTVDLYKQGVITKKEAHRLFTFANNSGPLFILGTVGVGMLNSCETGYILMIVHYVATFLIMCITTVFSEKILYTNRIVIDKHKEYSIGNIMGESVNKALNTILLIGGYIILFSVINAVLVKTGLIVPVSALFCKFGLEPEQAVGMSIGIFEVTNGCSIIANIPDKIAFVLCATIISWGGLSIHAQTASIIGETDLSFIPYILGKLFHSFLAFVLSLLFVAFFS